MRKRGSGTGGQTIVIGNSLAELTVLELGIDWERTDKKLYEGTVIS